MSWNYSREESTFAIPVGKYRIRVKSAEKTISKSGNEMLALQFDVSGKAGTLYYYVPFLTDRPQITNRMLTQIFDSFAAIPDGDFNFQHWLGKVGACVVGEDKNDASRTRITSFIRADKQDELPPWKEAGSHSSSVNTANAFVETEDDNSPF